MTIEETANKFCEKNGYDIGKIIAKNNRPKIQSCRKELAVHLVGAGFDYYEVSGFLKRNRTSIYYYLGGDKTAKEKYNRNSLLSEAIRERKNILRKISAIDKLLQCY